MKLVILAAFAFGLATPTLAQESKLRTAKSTVSTQSSLLIGTLGTSSAVSVATVLTLSAAQAVESTGHTK